MFVVNVQGQTDRQTDRQLKKAGTKKSFQPKKGTYYSQPEALTAI